MSSYQNQGGTYTYNGKTYQYTTPTQNGGQYSYGGTSYRQGGTTYTQGGTTYTQGGTTYTQGGTTYTQGTTTYVPRYSNQNDNQGSGYKSPYQYKYSDSKPQPQPQPSTYSGGYSYDNQDNQGFTPSTNYQNNNEAPQPVQREVQPKVYAKHAEFEEDVDPATLTEEWIDVDFLDDMIENKAVEGNPELKMAFSKKKANVQPKTNDNEDMNIAFMPPSKGKYNRNQGRLPRKDEKYNDPNAWF